MFVYLAVTAHSEKALRPIWTDEHKSGTFVKGLPVELICKEAMKKMRIFDYEHTKTLNDVSISLDRDEVDDLILNLQRLAARPDLRKVYLSDIESGRLERELAITLR